MTPSADPAIGPRLRPADLLLVFCGGAAGTALRAQLTAALPSELPVGVFAANVLGALALGLLLGVLAARGRDTGARRHLRLLLGVGLLGGFTTFSAVAVDTVRLSEQSLALGLGTAAANVGLGIAAAALGLAGGARLGARRGPAAPGGRA